MRFGIQAVAVAVLCGVAVAYFAVPARAQEACTRWVSEVQEGEGGPMLTAHACSDDPGATVLTLACLGSTIHMDYDMLAGTDLPDPEYGVVSEIEFVTDAGTESVALQYQAMDAQFGGGVSGRLLDLLKANSSVLVRDAAGAYPARTYSLAGSRAAITKLESECN